MFLWLFSLRMKRAREFHRFFYIGTYEMQNKRL